MTDQTNVYVMEPGSPSPRPKGKRGPKGPHKGQFRKGYDERRWLEGPSRPMKEFKVAIQDSAEQAVRVLDEILADESAPTRERRQAAELVLSHAHGLPVSRVMMAQVDAQGVSAREMDLDVLISRAQKMIGHESDD